jgi:PleD family two-component response regulator
LGGGLKTGSKADQERILVNKSVPFIPIETEDLQFQVTVSIGVYGTWPAAGGNLERALKLADRALYVSKQNGRNRVTLFKGEGSVALLRKDTSPK